MCSALFPWKWVCEFLTDFPEYENFVMGIIDRFPFILGKCSDDVKERLSLMHLEEFEGIACEVTPPAVATNRSPSSAYSKSSDEFRTCEQVLRSKVAASNSRGKEIAATDDRDLHQFILQKRAALEKNLIQMLKTVVLEGNHSDPSCSKELNNSQRDDPSLTVALVNDYRKSTNQDNTLLKSVGEEPQKDTTSLQLFAEQNAPDDDSRNQQTEVDDTCNEFLMEKTNKSNPCEGAAEFHDVETLSAKENSLDIAYDPSNTTDNFNKSHSEQGPQKHNVLHNDIPELQKEDDINIDAAQILEQLSEHDPSSQSLCIKCGGSGQVLNCSGEGCSKAIHESCLDLSTNVDKTNLFFCILCTFTNANKKLEKWKTKAEEARKNLVLFYNSTRSAVHSSKRNKISAMTTIAEVQVEHHLDSPSNQQFLNNSVEQRHGDIEKQDLCQSMFLVDDNPKITHEDKNQHDVMADTICQNNNILPCKKRIERYTYIEIEDSSKGKTGKKHEGIQVSEDQQPVNNVCVNNEDASRINRDHLQVSGRDLSAKRKALASKINDRFGKQNRRNYEQIRGNYKNNSASSDLRKSRHRQNQCSKVMKDCSRRPKLIWKPEEEGIIEEAMEKIPQNDDGSMPWIKILEYGRRFFHESRTPIDLKDKWRNMQKKKRKTEANPVKA